jgi:signal transduction histidine kinase
VIANSRLLQVADVVTELGVLPELWCNASDINQVILQLVVNGAQAIADKAGNDGSRGTLALRTRVEDGDIVLEVEDTGVGIAPDIADRVFDQFFTTRGVASGAGQGLATAYAIVHDHHGGSIRFETTLGRGTTFIVRLPAARLQRAA